MTLVSTTYVGAAAMAGEDPLAGGRWSAGFAFSIPLMTILLSHELGHFFAGRYHGIDVSAPYFIPMPVFLLGTMGAVIVIRGPIRTRNALLDVGASGPLIGLLVALPVLVYGLLESPVQPIPDAPVLIEGRSILYVALLYLTKGPIADGYDVFLTPTALAGWAGLWVTMLNLIPVGQLDGGHVAYALFGERQQSLSRRFRAALPWLAAGVGLAYAASAYARGKQGDALVGELQAGLPWLVWWVVLGLMRRMSPEEHPPTDAGPLSAPRKVVAQVTLGLLLLLFMPAWLRVSSGAP